MSPVDSEKSRQVSSVTLGTRAYQLRALRALSLSRGSLVDWEQARCVWNKSIHTQAIGGCLAKVREKRRGTV